MPFIKNDHYKCIFVSKSGRLNGCVGIESKDPFFHNKELIYRVFDDRIEFEVPTQMFNGRTIKTSTIRGEWRHISVRCDELEYRRYDFAEESTDEKVVIYY